MPRTVSRGGPSRVLKAFFKVPVWLYRARLGFLFGGRLIVLGHRGRKSGNRYFSGLEVIERRNAELFLFAAWGKRSDWYRNIVANGIDELWDGAHRTGATFRLVASDEAFSILSEYETAHGRAARVIFPRMMEGYDFTDQSGRQLAEAGLIVALTAQ